MGLFGNKNNTQVSASLTNEEKYGKAWLMIVGQKQKNAGLQIMKELDSAGYIEGTIALSMFAQNSEERKRLIKKAADAGNVEGLWEYCGFLKHSYVPDRRNPDDANWEKYCSAAAELGSADAMNEMGNVCSRRNQYAESMYWYVMANSNEHPDGQLSMAGIANKWVSAGCPYDFIPGTPKFDRNRHTCAITYLELYAGKELTTDINTIVQMAINGVSIAGYLAGDIFENAGNDEMAFRMYNALAFEHDAHAIRCLGDMYYYGKGTTRNPESAFKMYNLAAQTGDRGAMFIIGELTKAQNKNLAAYWYGVSHTRGYSPALQRLIQLA